LNAPRKGCLPETPADPTRRAIFSLILPRLETFTYPDAGTNFSHNRPRMAARIHEWRHMPGAAVKIRRWPRKPDAGQGCPAYEKKTAGQEFLPARRLTFHESRITFHYISNLTFRNSLTSPTPPA
jgi:hypothetical protein